MQYSPHHQRRRQLTLFAAVTILFLASASAFSFPPRVEVREEVAGEARRRLVGPGSSPPSCRSKCGRCTPCQPVLVPIHPGFTMKFEYYPEAWRCKCRDKIIMP